MNPVRTIKKRIDEKEEMLERGKSGKDPNWSSDKKHALRSKKKELEDLLEIFKTTPGDRTE